MFSVDTYLHCTLHTLLSLVVTELCCALQNLLTFVACRLFLPRGALRLPKSVANSLYQILAMVAQQFEGYIFSVNVEEVCLACVMELR